MNRLPTNDEIRLDHLRGLARKVVELREECECEVAPHRLGRCVLSRKGGQIEREYGEKINEAIEELIEAAR
jgi:hypothetical protein